MYAQSAIHSTQVSRRLLLHVELLISSTGSTALIKTDILTVVAGWEFLSLLFYFMEIV